MADLGRNQRSDLGCCRFTSVFVFVYLSGGQVLFVFNEQAFQLILEDGVKMAHQWYVVQVLSGWEQKVKDSLEKRLDFEDMRSHVSRILIPTENVSEVKSGKKTITKRKFFPGYILVEMEVNDKSWYFITQTNGIVGFAGEGEPVPLMEHEIDGILNQLEDRQEKVKPKVLFDKGENVKVIDGPFINFSGTIDEINPDKGKLKVMVSIFGRATSVELEFWQVERI